MKIKNEKLEYMLNDSAVDSVAEKVQSFLAALNMEKKNILRIRLTVEEILLNWQEHYDGEVPFTFLTGKRLGAPFISIVLAGESVNPLERMEEECGEWSSRLLVNMGISPTYSYSKGKNIITFKPKKEKMNPMVSLLGAVALAVVLGLLAQMLPASVHEMLTEYFVTPIYDAFLGVLTTVGIPVVFLAIVSGICGVGDVASFGKIGKRMVGKFLQQEFVYATIGTVLAIPFFKLIITTKVNVGAQLASVVGMVMDMLPKNIISPFLEGNCMQLIVIAVALGLTLLVMGERTKLITKGIEQLTDIGMFLLDRLNDVVPVFCFFVVLQLIMSGTAMAVVSAWKVLVGTILLALLGVIFNLIYVGRKKEISPVVLGKKLLPPVLIALATASSSAAFGTNSVNCTKKLGIDNKIVSFGLPIGNTLCHPGHVFIFLLCSLNMAEYYQVECSVVWFVIAAGMCAIMPMVMAPVVGGTAAAYTLLFNQLGIPMTALPVALALSVVCDFFATGLNMAYLQINLLLRADEQDLLDYGVLSKTNG